MTEESLNQVNLAKASSQPQSTYKVAATLTEFELKKILIDKMNTSESYLTALEHQEGYDGLIKSYNIDKDFFSSYDVYSLKRSRQDKDKYEGPSAGSGRGLKKRKTSKDAEPTTSPKNKDSTSRSSKGTKSQTKSSRKSVHLEEPEFEVGDINTPQGQERNLGYDDVKPRKDSASRYFSSYILNGLKIKNLTQEIRLGPTFRLLKGTRFNYAELEYDFEECNKALSEKLDWENPEGVTHVSVTRKHGYGYLEEIVVRRADNVLYKFKEGDFPRPWINDIEDMLLLVVQNLLINLSGDDVADFVIALRMFTKSLVIQKRVEDLQLGVESNQKHINVTKPDTTRLDLRERHPYTPYKDPQGFIYVDDYQRNRLMHSDELYKFSDGTLTMLLSSFKDIIKNIDIEYLPKRRWSKLEKKIAYFMIKDINKLLKEKRMMRSLEKFVGGRLYGTDLRLLQRTI
nr:hypothetical protein [Tanacetum cinerariifolium]